jgi:hypothetical protein
VLRSASADAEAAADGFGQITDVERLPQLHADASVIDAFEQRRRSGRDHHNAVMFLRESLDLLEDGEATAVWHSKIDGSLA